MTSLIIACTKNASNIKEVDCSTAKSFAADVTPVVQSSCSFDSDCHGSGSTSGPGELLNYSQIFSAKSTIRSEVASGGMPKDKNLTSAEKNAILRWIDSGAPNN